jgi:transposase-like protein
MSRRKPACRQGRFTSQFKFKVVLETLSERSTIQELGRKYVIHPGQITQWERQFIKQGESLFERPILIMNCNEGFFTDIV